MAKKFLFKPSLKEGYVLIDEVESSLHYSPRAKLVGRIKEKYRKIVRRENAEEVEVTIFVASGPAIDKKIEEMNKRITRKLLKSDRE